MNTELILFLQELLVTLLIFLLLLLRLGKPVSAAVYLNITLLFVAATGIRLLWISYRGVLFSGLFATVPMMVIQKTILLLAAFLLLLLNYESLKKHPHLPELLMLLLTSLLGMLLLISSGTMLMLYLSLELATLPLAALVNFDLGKKSSSEAAMKMIFSSAFASGILLFGISLFYGAYGTLRFAEIPYVIKGSSLEIMAFLFMITGFAFKLSAVPFHFWTADVYEGAPTTVTAFLSVVSKAAVAFVFLSFLYRVFQALGQTTQTVLTLLSLLSLVVGNLFALRQQNLKRFLAFSSITQMGFVLVAISSGSTLSTPAVIYFMLIYLFSNLAAFGVVELVSLATGRETIAELAGLYQHNKWLSWVFVIALFSLAGIPPTAGFFGKLFLILAGAIKGSVGFIILVVFNMVIALYYYLRIVRAIFAEVPEGGMKKIAVALPTRWGLWICVLGMLVTGFVGRIYEYLQSL